MPQTTIQQTAAIRKGSVRVLIGDDASSLVDIGALRNPVFNALVGQQTIAFDNVDDLKKFVNGKKVQVTFDLAEINFTNIAKLDAGLVTVTPVAGSPVSNATHVPAASSWAFDRFIPLPGQNADGSKPTIDSVVGGTDGALVLNTDYFVVQEGGVWGIVIRDSSTVTTVAQAVTITYDYTPAASKTITFADSGTKTLKYMRLMNTDEAGKKFQIDIQDGTNMAPISIDFAGDDEEDVAVLPIQFEGNLVSIVDEQQTA